jgi:hypothetical protein
MQTIADKSLAIRAVAHAAGIKGDAIRHLIHGCGGSPRRAKRAIKAGVAELLAETYKAALDSGLSHTQAVIRCNEVAAPLLAVRETTESAQVDMVLPEPAAAEPARKSRRGRKAVH